MAKRRRSTRRPAPRAKTLGYIVMEQTTDFQFFTLQWSTRDGKFYIGSHVTVFPTMRRARRAITLVQGNPAGIPWDHLIIKRVTAELIVKGRS